VVTLDLKLDTNVMMYLFIVILLATIALSIRFKSGMLFKVIFKMSAGGLFIYIFNFIGKNFDVIIPLNIATALITGFLELPGLAFIFILKYIIY
jgi:inhibitor of the pro-sigma K processing machinery